MTKEILIIRLSSIGDVVHCTPVAESLKTAWPDCKITWLVGEVSADLLKYNPYIDEIIIWSRERFEKHLRSLEFSKALTIWQNLRNMLASRKFYAVLDIHGLFLTGMIAKQAKAVRRIGLSGAREFNTLFMTETAAPFGNHITDKYLGVLRPLGITSVKHKMTVIVPEEIKRLTEDFLKDKGIAPYEKYAVLVPGTTWPSKNWPSCFFIETVRLLHKNFKIVLCGGKAELNLGMEIENTPGLPVVNTIGQTGLLEMAGIIERASVVITGDTGPLHIAAALGTPTIALFGPTDPSVYAPLGKKSAILVNRLPCSFCHKTKCPKGDAYCIKSITPDKVVQEVYKVARGARHFGDRATKIIIKARR